LDEYLLNIKKLRFKIGAVVVNCNPFTLGHRYLIQYAAAKCDRLYIFVVEEDRSFFPFSDRIELVKLGVKDISNVVVIPSGQFIISQRTFEAYSNKEALQNEIVDASLDIEIFGEKIAPELGITVRFAGEEPIDNVTRQYNDTMRRMLPQYGIEFEVVNRKKEGDKAISASRVRQLLENKNFSEISKLVPKTTLKYLKNKYRTCELKPL
jgi:[citrate (pro-3S)-lyase] ligase